MVRTPRYPRAVGLGAAATSHHDSFRELHGGTPSSYHYQRGYKIDEKIFYRGRFDRMHQYKYEAGLAKNGRHAQQTIVKKHNAATNLNTKLSSAA